MVKRWRRDFIGKLLLKDDRAITPRPERLFSGESLAVLVDVHPITVYTDSSGVANASVRPFSHSNSGHG